MDLSCMQISSHLGQSFGGSEECEEGLARLEGVVRISEGERRFETLHGNWTTAFIHTPISIEMSKEGWRSIMGTMSKSNKRNVFNPIQNIPSRASIWSSVHWLAETLWRMNWMKETARFFSLFVSTYNYLIKEAKTNRNDRRHAATGTLPECDNYSCTFKSLWNKSQLICT